MSKMNVLILKTIENSLMVVPMYENLGRVSDGILIPSYPEEWDSMGLPQVRININIESMSQWLVFCGARVSNIRNVGTFLIRYKHRKNRYPRKHTAIICLLCCLFSSIRYNNQLFGHRFYFDATDFLESRRGIGFVRQELG